MAVKKLLGISFFFLTFFAYGQVPADSLHSTLKRVKDGAARIQALNALAAYYNRDSTNQALLYANQAYLLSLKKDDRRLQAASLLNLSEGYLYNDAYDQALQYGFMALDLSEQLQDKPEIANAVTNLGWIFYDTENTEFALQYHRMAHALYRDLGDRKKQAVALNAIGLTLQLQNEHDSARLYFERSLHLAQQEGLTKTIAAAYNNIGICDNNAGRYASAITNLQKAYDLQATLNNPLSQAETLNQLAYSSILLKNYEKARLLLQAAKGMIEEATSNTKKEKLLDNLNISSRLHQALGNYRQAFEDLQYYTEVRNQIISRAKSEAIASLKMKREMQEAEARIRELKAQEALRSFQRNALLVVIALIFVIGFLLYSKLKQKQKKEKELEEMKQVLIRQELENVVLEKENLQNKLDFKNTELKNYALYISQRNEMVRGFINDLCGLKLETELKKESLQKFHRMIQLFQYDLDNNRDAREFNLSVAENHKDFFYNLLQKYPGLTENEQRLCAQIRLNLSIKDIASLNNISVKSAEMARYRLRKHFGLEPAESLNEFLKQF